MEVFFYEKLQNMHKNQAKSSWKLFVDKTKKFSDLLVYYRYKKYKVNWRWNKKYFLFQSHIKIFYEKTNEKCKSVKVTKMT